MRLSLLAILATLLFFSGCGGENTNDCKYDVSYALDKGEYDSVIKTLEEQNQSCGFSNDEKNLNIAAAYIGKAGLTIVDIVNNMLKSDDNGNGFGSFVESMSNDNASNNLLYFNKAKSFYDKIPGDCSDTNSSSNLFKDSCFYSGLMQISQSANSISLILGGGDEVTKWQDSSTLTPDDDKNNNQKADSVDATARAIDYSFTGDTNTTNGIATSVEQNVTFTKNSSNYTYELIKISVGSSNPNEFYKLISNDTPRSPIITDGVCKTDLQKYSVDADGATYFPCPVIDDSGKTMNTNDQLVDVINNGLDNIINIADSGDSDTKKSSDDYKKDLDKNGDGNITLDEISDFLNK